MPKTPAERLKRKELEARVHARAAELKKPASASGTNKAGGTYTDFALKDLQQKKERGSAVPPGKVQQKVQEAAEKAWAARQAEQGKEEKGPERYQEYKGRNVAAYNPEDPEFEEYE